MPFPYEEFDLSGVRTYPLSSRRSKARAEDFARPVERGASFADWFDSLPAMLGAKDVRRVVQAIVHAHRELAAGDAKMRAEPFAEVEIALADLWLP